jgi:hypothetical protein
MLGQERRYAHFSKALYLQDCMLYLPFPSFRYPGIQLTMFVVVTAAFGATIGFALSAMWQNFASAYYVPETA